MTLNVAAKRLVFAAVIAVLGSVNVGGQKPVDDPWANLQHRTAWIILGMIEKNSGDWATLSSYQIVDGINDGRMPRKGDLLSIIDPLNLNILNFRKTAEKDRMSPLLGTVLGDLHLTGGVLRKGHRVRVEEVKRATGDRCTNLCTVWARVTPAK